MTDLPAFSRQFFEAPDSQTRIGAGELGGKAKGLIAARELLRDAPELARFTDVKVRVPRMAVVATGVFDAFVKLNRLDPAELAELPDRRIAMTFQHGEIPVEIVGDLRALVDDLHQPLAVRSSALLEDALGRPFAGVYSTKMIPNDSPDPNERFRRLVEAIKFVWASAWFRSARDYLAGVGGARPPAEKMAVVLQEVVGHRFDGRFYPHLSGVVRSVDYYPAPGSRPEDGVVALALGLGKTIVDGDLCWSYSPARPTAPPPFGSPAEMLDATQTRFWAVRMGKPPAWDPVDEAEYLVHEELREADLDGTLRWVASTLDPDTGRLSPGTGREGPRVLDFAPLLRLRELPWNDVMRALVAACERALGEPVEIEFAATIEPGPAPHARLGFLQVRPLVVDSERVEIDDAELDSPLALVSARRAMGNGSDASIVDVVYVVPERFDAAHTRAIADEIGEINERLVAEGRPYLLIGFGRWGTRDPWLGIPVDWSRIRGARSIVEATLATMNVEPSQGSHFFHNLSSFGVTYLMAHHESGRGIDWAWLAGRTTIAETAHVRHVRIDAPLRVKVDGRAARGGVWRADEA